MRLRRLRRNGQKAFLVAGLLLLALPALWMLTEPPRAVSERENRSLAPWPQAPTGWQALRDWPVAAGAWLQDHLGGRDRLLAAMAWLRRTLREPGGTDVVFGAGEWLYYARAARLEMAAGRSWLDAAHRRRVRQLLDDWRDAAAAAGMPLVVLLAPDKESIETAALPWWARRFNTAPATRRLVDELRDEGGFTVIDLRPLLAGDDSGRARYWPYDTHWTIWSGYLAAGALLETLAPHWPGARLLQGDQISWISMPYVQDLWRMLGEAPDPAREVTDQPWPRRFQATMTKLPDGITISQRPDLQGPRVVLSGDSFRNALKPWLEESLPSLIDVPLEPPSRLPGALLAHPGDVLVVVLVERDLHPDSIGRLIGR
jgi:hypothetical protein